MRVLFTALVFLAISSCKTSESKEPSEVKQYTANASGTYRYFGQGIHQVDINSVYAQQIFPVLQANVVALCERAYPPLSIDILAQKNPAGLQAVREGFRALDIPVYDADPFLLSWCFGMQVPGTKPVQGDARSGLVILGNAVEQLAYFNQHLIRTKVSNLYRISILYANLRSGHLSPEGTQILNRVINPNANALPTSLNFTPAEYHRFFEVYRAAAALTPVEAQDYNQYLNLVREDFMKNQLALMNGLATDDLSDHSKISQRSDDYIALGIRNFILRGRFTFDPVSLDVMRAIPVPYRQ